MHISFEDILQYLNTAQVDIVKSGRLKSTQQIYLALLMKLPCWLQNGKLKQETLFDTQSSNLAIGPKTKATKMADIQVTVQ